MPFVICFRIDKWTESTLSIASSHECSIVQLLIPIVEFIASVSKVRNTKIDRELKKESIECRPWSSNTFRQILKWSIWSLYSALLSFAFSRFPYTMRSRFTFSNFQERKHVKTRHFRNITFVVNIIIKSQCSLLESCHWKSTSIQINQPMSPVIAMFGIYNQT